uniref:ATP-binding cassette transporter subfamily B member 1-like protein X10 n=1 Tax=Brachionus rotundiformis TaxID=96890 RepID=A0A7H9SKV2_9BILA|nr:ATP-binding cassette transporter subfamily B member 1-like protein X10 [Brachionus rotundiformis]
MRKKQKNEMNIPFSKLFAYSNLIDKILLITGGLMAIFSGAIFPMMYFMYGQIVGIVIGLQSNRTNTQPSFCSNLNTSDIEADFENQTYNFILYYVYFGLGSIVSNFMVFVCLEKTAERQIKIIRNKLFKSLLKQDIAFYDANSSVELSSRLLNNLSTLRTGFGYKIGDFVSILSRALACFIYAMISAWKFGLVMLSILPFMIISTVLMVMFIKKYSIQEYVSYGSAGQIAQEALSSIRTVLSFGTVKKVIKNYRNNLVISEKIGLKKGFFTGFFLGFSLFFYNLVFAIGIFYGPYLAREECEQFSAENILRSLFLMITATLSFGQALPFLKEITEAKTAANDIFKMIDRNSAIDAFDQDNKIKLNKIEKEISFKNVEFAYPQRSDLKVLSEINFSLPIGKTVAFCGSSGCGKTTILQLLLRFYDPNSGSIEIDNVDIKNLNLKWLREQTALVSQEPILFSTSIRENIRLGRLDATDLEIEEAAKHANAHDFIIKFNEKYDTQVGERGSQLSGGQKQRIAVARAILKNPKILLLDEATSALDSYNENMVQNAIGQTKIGRTTIIVAHRLKTIQDADITFYLDRGKIIEMGTHDDLMNLKGYYYNLFITQTNAEVNAGIKKDKISFDDEKSMVNIQISDKEETILTNSKNYTGFSKIIFELWKNHLPEKLFILIGIISQLLAGLVVPVASILFTEIYTIFSLEKKEQENLSLRYLLIILAIGLSNIIFYTLSNFSFSLIGSRLTKRLRVKSFEAYLRQEIAFHDRDENKSNILATHLAASIPFCRSLTSDVLSLVCQALSSVGFCIIFGLVIEWKLCLVIISLVPINFLSGFINFQPAKSQGKSYEEQIGSHISEALENLKTIISFTREEHFYDLFTKITNGKSNFLYLILKGFFYALSNSVLFFMQAIAFAYAYKNLLNGTLLLASFFKVYATITFSSIALGQLFSQIPDLKKAKSAATSTIQILNRKSKIDPLSDDGIKPANLYGNIDFVNVKFSYPNRAGIIVLDNLCLKIRARNRVALVGYSGCGKSTCIALLLRFYDVDQGEILLDGIDIRKLNISWLRSKIGLISQEPTLYDTSIKENICYGLSDFNNVSIGELENVAKMSNIYDFVLNLPEKFETKIGLKGSKLSGGEKQRLAIARMLIVQPSILLLDEATSALDNQSMAIVHDALKKAQNGRTCLLISHKLNIVQETDKTYVLNEGNVVEEGTFNGLIQKKGLFFDIFSLS